MEIIFVNRKSSKEPVSLSSLFPFFHLFNFFSLFLLLEYFSLPLFINKLQNDKKK